MTSTAPPTTDDLLAEMKLPWGGRFFEQSSALTTQQIDAAFDQLLTLASEIADTDLKQAGLPSRTTYRVTRVSGPKKVLGGATAKVWYSVLLTSFGRRPALAPTSALIEYRYGYVVLCEFEVRDAARAQSRFLFVQRDLLGDPLEQISPPAHKHMTATEFLEPFLQPVRSGPAAVSPRLERLSMRIMASARGEVTRKMVEAHDIEAAISSLGLHRAVPGGMSIAVPRGRGIATVSVNPARQSVRVSSSRRSLLEVVDWAAAGSIRFHESRGVTRSSSSFIDSMAQPVTEIRGLKPLSVMIERYALDGILQQHAGETGEIWTARKSTPPGLSWKELLDSLSELAVLPTPKKRDGSAITAVSAEPEAYYDIEVPQFPTSDRLRLCVSKQSCKLILPASLGGLAVPGKAKSPSGLEEIVNKFRAFRVVLGTGDVLYCADGAYKASNVRLAIGQLSKIIKVIPALRNVHTEKGRATAGATAFDPTSSFAVIVNHLRKDCDVLICDDGPTEWCDFLALTSAPPRMTWIHAKVQSVEDSVLRVARKKAKKDAIAATAAGSPVPVVPVKVTLPVSTAPSLSASALEEVIGQAVKNLARLRTPVDDVSFQARRTDWVSNSCSLLAPAVIPRLVEPASGTTADAIGDVFGEIATHPFATLEVAIVVPNYSKAALDTAFSEIASGTAAGNVLQMFWLLSGFMHSCLEVGAQPAVYVHD